MHGRPSSITNRSTNTDYVLPVMSDNRPVFSALMSAFVNISRQSRDIIRYNLYLCNNNEQVYCFRMERKKGIPKKVLYLYQLHRSTTSRYINIAPLKKMIK